MAVEFDEICSSAVQNCLIYCRKEAGSDAFNKAFESFINFAYDDRSMNSESLAPTLSKCASVIREDCKAYSFMSFANRIADVLTTSVKPSNLKIVFSLEKFFELHY